MSFVSTDRVVLELTAGFEACSEGKLGLSGKGWDYSYDDKRCDNDQRFYRFSLLMRMFKE